MICTRCRFIPGELFEENDCRYNHSDTYDELKESANAGCHICTLLLAYYIRLPGSGRVENHGKEPVILYGRISDKSVPSAPRPALVEGKSIGWLPVATDKGFKLGKCESVGLRADAPSTIRAVLKCIDNCLGNHVHCSKPNPNGLLPTRLLDVGPPDGLTLPRLCSGQQCRAFAGRYLALSYTWGKKLPIRTTISNKEQMMKGISWKSLPLTFQEAICITRRLGVRFIWIDALCIIQDSKEDWEHEASIMGEIYSQALCSLVAHASSDCYEGLLKIRDPVTVSPATLRLSRKCGEKISVTFYPRVPSFDTLNDQSPLSTRGWTLQEQELSSRVLCFTSHRTVWQCFSTGWTDNTFSSHDHFRFDDNLAKRALCSSVISQQNSKEELYNSWYSTICGFSNRQFTVITDKLVAISAVARKVQERVSDTYFAGLWKNDLPYGLQWYASPGQAGTHHWQYKRTAEYVAPSWSWASIEKGCLLYNQRMHVPFSHLVRMLPKVIDVGVYLQGKDLFGQLKGGFITLHGWITHAKLFAHEPDALSAEIGDPDDFMEGRSPPSGKWLGYLHFDAYQDFVEQADVYCLCLYDMGPLDGNSGAGLGLAKMGDNNSNVYRRVGYVQWNQTSWYYDSELCKATIV